jgi:hypothetical protein
MQLGTGMIMLDGSQKARKVEKKIDDKQSDGCREKPV